MQKKRPFEYLVLYCITFTYVFFSHFRVIKNAYYQHYRKKLEEDLHGDTSGDFRRLLISMCACARDESNCDPALANSLAQQLYKAG